MAITVKEAQTLFVSYFGRPADFEGLQYWTGTETLVGSLEQLAHSFYNSAEGKKYFPVDPATNQIDVTASINAIYANMFARVPDTAGFDYWYNEIASGKINLAEAAVAIYKGAQGKDALMIENKIAAAIQFTDQVAASDKPSLYYGDQAFAKANEFLNTVTDVTDVTSAGFAAQVNAAVNIAEAAGAVTGEGGTFKLDVDPTLISAGGTLTNEVNVGFKPEGKYLTAGNDVIELYEWDGTKDVIISDIFSNDNDKVSVLADRLSPVATGSGKLKLTAVENLEIISSVPSSVKLTGANFKGLESIELKGDTTNLNVSDFTYGVKIDATENADTIFGGLKADTINGGAGNDIIQGNQGNDVLTGGNGADTFIVDNAKDFGVDQILDFSAEDKISMAGGFSAQVLKKFDASTFSTVTYKTLDSVLATFAAGGANVTGSGDVVIFSYDGKTYALLSTGIGFKEATDALVDITGANVASLTETNFGGASSTPTPTPTPTPPATTYDTYAEFVNAVTFGQIPAGEKVGIKTLTGAEAGLLAVNKTYLDKIAAGGIVNVDGDIVVTVGTTGNASNNFDSSAFASKLATGAVGSTVMNINGSTAADVIVTTFGGTINGGAEADIITAYAAATINGDAGNDIIHATAGGSINGGTGDDTINVSGTGATTINGGANNDTISLGAGADTVVFANTATANGTDTITGFTAGAGGDKLNFKAFSADLTVGNLNVGSTAKQVLNTVDKKIYQTTINDNIASKDYSNADFGELFHATNNTPFTTAITSSGTDLIVVKGNDVTQIYYVNDTGNDGTVAANDDVFLVAVIDNNGSGVTLTADNFVF